MAQDPLLLNDNDNCSPNPLAQVKVRLIRNSLFNNKDQMNIDRQVDQLLVAQIRKCNTSSVKSIHTYLYNHMDRTPTPIGVYTFTIPTKEFDALALGILPEVRNGKGK